MLMIPPAAVSRAYSLNGNLLGGNQLASWKFWPSATTPLAGSRDRQQPLRRHDAFICWPRTGAASATGMFVWRITGIVVSASLLWNWVIERES